MGPSKCSLKSEARARTSRSTCIRICSSTRLDVTRISIADYRLHPAILDAAIHVMVHPILTGNYDSELYHLPSRVSSIRLLGSGIPSKIIYSYITLVKWTPGTSCEARRGLPKPNAHERHAPRFYYIQCDHCRRGRRTYLRPSRCRRSVAWSPRQTP